MTPPPPGDTGPDGEQFADGRGRYRLDSRIATGGMGEVWRATDTLLGRQVAVKLLKHEFADDATFRSRFADEAQHAAALDHPGVAAVYDVGEAAPGGGSTTPRPFLVMELVDGEPLSTLLRQGRDGGRAIDRDVLRDLLAQAATAIGAAHAAGIVHRDVKPANLLVTRDRRIKITDFGIARAADAVGITQTGQVMGTPQYLSPEQARGEAATPASDVYALGVVAFECLAGRRPFEADSPVATALAHLQQPVPDLPDDVPADLAAVVRTALAKDPAARYPNGSAFADALREPATAVLPGGMAAAALAGGAFGAAEGGTRVMPAAGATPPPPSTLETPVAAPPPAKSGESRSRVLLAVVGAIVLALVALGLVFALRGGDGTTPPPAKPSSRAPTSASTEPTPTQDPTTEAPTPTPTPTPTTAAPTTEAPDTVTINGSDYVGAQVDGVSAQLSELGLNVQRSEIPNDGSGAQGEVTDVSPDGELEVGSSVTVTFLGAPAAPTETSTPSESVPSPSQTTEAPGNSGDSNSGNGGGNGNADGPVVPAPTPSTTSPSVPPAPAASPAATPAPGATASPGVDPGVDPGSLPTGAAG